MEASLGIFCQEALHTMYGDDAKELEAVLEARKTNIVDALNRTTWFCSCVLSIQISIILILKIIESRLVKRR